MQQAVLMVTLPIPTQQPVTHVQQTANNVTVQLYADNALQDL